ncbi:MAG TPA: hypothetical protein IAB89_07180, partial [Candidatus Caccousia avicola]|nr:hypothetical protein [Candidatus Caccousia avicola]
NGQILIEKPVDLAVHDFMDEKYRLVECPIENDDEPEENDNPVEEAAEEQELPTENEQE